MGEEGRIKGRDSLGNGGREGGKKGKNIKGKKLGWKSKTSEWIK